MYRLSLLLFVAVIYFGGHAVYGYLNCVSDFCPGDSEKDWVYEYTDDNGKKFIVEDGASVPKEQYKGAR
jgi:hypothetical protein